MQFISHPPGKLCIDASVAELARALTTEFRQCACDPLIVTGQDAYLGMVNLDALAHAVTEALRAQHGRNPAWRSLAPEPSGDLLSINYCNSCYGFDYFTPDPGDP